MNSEWVDDVINSRVGFAFEMTPVWTKKHLKIRQERRRGIQKFISSFWREKLEYKGEKERKEKRKKKKRIKEKN